MFGSFGAIVEPPGPNYEDEGEEKQLKVNPYKHIKLGEVLKKLAIIELKTDEPVQFIVRSGSPQEMAVYVQRLCQQWDEYFSDVKAKKRGVFY